MQRLMFILFLLTTAFQNAHAAPAPKEFGTLPAVYDAAISPDGNRVAMFYNNKGTYGISVMSVTTKKTKARVIMLGKGVKPRWIEWANNDFVLASIWQSEETESYKASGSNIVTKGVVYTATYLHAINVTKMKSKVLVRPTRVRRQYNDNVIDFLKNDPEHILMNFSNINANAPDLQKVHVATGATKKIETGSENIQYWYTDLTGAPRVKQGLKDNTRKEKWRLEIRDADSDTWRDHEDYPGLAAGADIIGFTGNPNELIIRTYAGKDTKGLYVYDLIEKKQTRKLFHNENYDARNVVLNANGDDVIGASFVSDSNEITLFGDYKSVLDKIRAESPGYEIDYIDQSKDGNTILFKASNAYDPGMLMMYKSDSAEMIPIVKYRGSLPSSEMGVVIPTHYISRDGSKIPAFVTVPPAITDTAQLKNIPFIVLPHGGPYARDSKRFDYFAQFFASRGFGVLQMNFRGSAGYGKTFEQAGRKNWVVMQEDVEDGTRWLIEKGYADPDRICIVGWSYGGYAALMGAIKNPELYACSVSMAGVTDLQDMIIDIRKYRFGRISAQNFVLKGFEDSDAIKENSPVKRASEYKVPLFLAHGEADVRVHFDQFKRMKRALKKSPAKVTYMEFKDEDHFLSDQANRQRFFVGLDRFLNETVGKSEYKTK